MNSQQVRDIAEAAFKARFGDIDIVSINVKPGFGFEDDSPVVDVNIIYDGTVEQLGGEGILRVLSEVVEKAWEDVQESPGYPCVHFIAKSDLEEAEDPATV